MGRRDYGSCSDSIACLTSNGASFRKRYSTSSRRPRHTSTIRSTRPTRLSAQSLIRLRFTMQDHFRIIRVAMEKGSHAPVGCGLRGRLKAQRMPTVIPACSNSCSTSNRSRGCCLSSGATSLPPYMSSSDTTEFPGLLATSHAHSVSTKRPEADGLRRASRNRPDFDFDAVARTSSLVSPASAEATACIWKPCF